MENRKTFRMLAAAASGMLAIPVIASPAPAAGQLVLRGVVHSAVGDPVAGVRVSFGYGGIVTNALGEFAFTTDATGADKLMVQSHRGMATDLPKRFRMVWRDPGFTSDSSVDITLPAAVKQQFRVVDAEGDPAASGSVGDAHQHAWERGPDSGDATGLGAGSLFQKLRRVNNGARAFVFADPQYQGLQVVGSPAVPADWGTTSLSQELPSVPLGGNDPIVASLPRTGTIRGQVAIDDASPLLASLAFSTQPDVQIAQATTSNDGHFHFLAPLGVFGSIQAQGYILGDGPATNPGHLNWDGVGTLWVHRHNTWDITLPTPTSVRVHVRQNGTPSVEARVSAEQSLSSFVGTAWMPIQASSGVYTDADGDASLPVFSGIDTHHVGVYQSGRGHGSNWSAAQHLDVIDAATPEVTIDLPPLSRIVGDIRVPTSWWFYEGLLSYSSPRETPGYLSGYSRGTSINLPVDRRGAQIEVRGNTLGRHAPDSFVAMTPFKGNRTHSDLVAPDAVTVHVTLVDRDGTPVTGLRLTTPFRDRARPVQLFTGLPESNLTQILRSSPSDTHGQALLGAFPDRHVQVLEVHGPSGELLTTLHDVNLSSDRRLEVVVGTAEHPISR